jgi:hypothetical protein
MFQDAKRQVEHDLKELQDQELSFGVDSTEYRDYCNSKAFIGHMPEWRHLFMGAFGAFPRPKKESDLLSAINKNAEKLDTRKKGLLFHVVSGDSGSGKSALAKLVMHRLCENINLDPYPLLSRSVFRVFEIEQLGDWDALQSELRTFLRGSSQNEQFVYLLFFDDIFAEEREDIERLFEVLSIGSENARIYFLATSPSWLFSRRELQTLRHAYNLIESVETIVGGLDIEDRDVKHHEL